MLAFAASTAACACWIAASLVHLGGVEGCLLALNVGFGRLLSRQRVVIVLLRHGSQFGQGLEPIDILIGLVQLRHRNLQVGLRHVHHGSILGLRQVRLRLGQLCLGLHELGLILALVEGEEHLPRFDHLAFVVALLQQEGFHPGANIHRVGSVDARGQLGENRHGLLNDRRDYDGDGGTERIRPWH